MWLATDTRQLVLWGQHWNRQNILTPSIRNRHLPKQTIKEIFIFFSQFRRCPILKFVLHQQQIALLRNSMI